MRTVIVASVTGLAVLAKISDIWAGRSGLTSFGPLAAVYVVQDAFATPAISGPSAR